jgi:hypothetical protein
VCAWQSAHLHEVELRVEDGEVQEHSARLRVRPAVRLELRQLVDVPAWVVWDKNGSYMNHEDGPYESRARAN